MESTTWSKVNLETIVLFIEDNVHAKQDIFCIYSFSKTFKSNEFITWIKSSLDSIKYGITFSQQFDFLSHTISLTPYLDSETKVSTNHSLSKVYRTTQNL